MGYFPTLKENEFPDWELLLGIIETLKTNSCKILLDDERKARSKGSEEYKNDLIKVDPEF